MKRLLFYIIFIVSTILCTAQEIKLSYDGTPIKDEVQLNARKGFPQKIEIEFSFNNKTKQIKLSITPKFVPNKNRAIWFPRSGGNSNSNNILNLCRQDLPRTTFVSQFYRSQAYWGINRAFECTNCSWDDTEKNAIEINEFSQESIVFSFTVEDLEKPVSIKLQNASILQRKSFLAPNKQKLAYIADSISWKFKVDIPPCETQEAREIVYAAKKLKDDLNAFGEEINELKRSHNKKALNELNDSLKTKRDNYDSLETRYDLWGKRCTTVDSLLDNIAELLPSIKGRLGTNKYPKIDDAKEKLKNITQQLIRCCDKLKTPISSQEREEVKRDCRKMFGEADRIIERMNKKFTKEINDYTKLKKTIQNNFF